jgi:hypothetical protein
MDKLNLTCQNIDASICLLMCQASGKTIRKRCELCTGYIGPHFETIFIDPIIIIIIIIIIIKKFTVYFNVKCTNSLTAFWATMYKNSKVEFLKMGMFPCTGNWVVT